jgi:FkbM family methyltransferase
MAETAERSRSSTSLTGQRGIRANVRRLQLIRKTFRGWLLPTALLPLGTLLQLRPGAWKLAGPLEHLTATVTTRDDRLRVTLPLLDSWPAFEVFAFEEYGFSHIPWGSLRTVIDCGAHVGSFALWVSRKTHARIVCVEPNPSVFPLLQQNLLPLRDQARVWQLAIAGQPGTRTLHDQGFAAAASFHQRSPRGQTYAVEAVTLDELLDRSRFSTVDLLKMDVEGAEREVFETVRPETLRRVGAALIECHPFAGTRVPDIIEKLLQAGMQVEEAPYMVIGWRPPVP